MRKNLLTQSTKREQGICADSAVQKNDARGQSLRGKEHGRNPAAGLEKIAASKRANDGRHGSSDGTLPRNDRESNDGDRSHGKGKGRTRSGKGKPFSDGAYRHGKGGGDAGHAGVGDDGAGVVCAAAAPCANVSRDRVVVVRETVRAGAPTGAPESHAPTRPADAGHAHGDASAGARGSPAADAADGAPSTAPAAASQLMALIHASGFLSSIEVRQALLGVGAAETETDLLALRDFAGAFAVPAEGCNPVEAHAIAMIKFDKFLSESHEIADVCRGITYAEISETLASVTAAREFMEATAPERELDGMEPLHPAVPAHVGAPPSMLAPGAVIARAASGGSSLASTPSLSPCTSSSSLVSEEDWLDGSVRARVAGNKENDARNSSTAQSATEICPAAREEPQHHRAATRRKADRPRRRPATNAHKTLAREVPATASPKGPQQRHRQQQGRDERKRVHRHGKTDSATPVSPSSSPRHRRNHRNMRKKVTQPGR